MIIEETYSPDWILEISQKKRNADPILIEMLILARCLLHVLAENRQKFIFMGGSALLLISEIEPVSLIQRGGDELLRKILLMYCKYWNIIESVDQYQAQIWINLVRLVFFSSSSVKSTIADSRSLLRQEAQNTAISSYGRWSNVKDDLTSPYRRLMAEQIAATSIIGFYAIWCKVFEGEKMVLDEIDKIWKDRYYNYFKFLRKEGTDRILVPYGQI